MDEDDFKPRIKKDLLTPRDLSSLSVEEMQDYISALKKEIARTETDIAKKQAHKDEAAALFKS